MKNGRGANHIIWMYEYGIQYTKRWNEKKEKYFTFCGVMVNLWTHGVDKLFYFHLKFY